MDIKKKKVVIMGLGLHGGGLAAAKWFFKQGAEVIVTDLKAASELAPSIEKLDQFCREYRLSHQRMHFTSIEYVLGKHREKDFLEADIIIQNPGVPRDSFFLEMAHKKGIRIENEATLFFLLTPNVLKVGITGTRGKSTTVHLTYEMAKRLNPATVVAGSATATGAVAFFDALDKVHALQERGSKPIAIVELSSWQLELFEKEKIRPSIAVITNILRDHLNRYGSMEEYAAAKKHIACAQDPSDTLILNYDNALTRSIGKEGIGAGTVEWYSQKKNVRDASVFLTEGVAKKKRGVENRVFALRRGNSVEIVCPVREALLKGEHNISNIMAALAVAKKLGVRVEDMAEVIRSWPGLPQRQEVIGECMGRRFVNDTTATTPDGTIAALQTLGSQRARRIVLIAGGADKKCEFREFARIADQMAHTIIFLSGTATPLMVSALKSFSYSGKVEMANSMDEAVEKAWASSRKNDTILLSPGAASFGLFIHEFERGKKFCEAFEDLKRRCAL